VRALVAPAVKRLGTHDTGGSGTTHSLATGIAVYGVASQPRLPSTAAVIFSRADRPNSTPGR
jgi:hypothetical protein